MTKKTQIKDIHLSARSIELLVQNNDGKPPSRIRTQCYLHAVGHRFEWVHERVNDTPPYTYALRLQEVPYK